MSSDHVVQITPAFHPAPDQLYSSLPVPPGSSLIRVLDLFPLRPDTRSSFHGAGNFDTCSVPLAGTLRIVKLTDSPRFAALSYVWGNEKSADHTLAISTARNRDAVWELNLTKNCHSALVHLRQQFVAMTVWVDSICINQQDNDEKSTQIPLMEQIFSWANPVYIWLGDGNERSDKAIAALSKAATYDSDLDMLGRLLYPNKGMWTRVVGWLRYLKTIWVRGHLSAIRGWQTIFAGCKCSSTYFSPSKRLKSLYDAECLEELLGSHHRRWSQRAWTLQELLLAGNIVVVCGNKAMLWDTFVRGINYTQQIQQLDTSIVMQRTLSKCVYEWFLLLNLWFNFERPSKWNGRTKRHSPSNFQRIFRKRSYRRVWWTIYFISIYLLLNAPQLKQYLAAKQESGREQRLTFDRVCPIVVSVLVLVYAVGFGIGRYADSTRIKPGNSMVYPYTGNPRKARSSITQPIRTIDTFMYEVRHRIASDPRDKSYAMYGILKSFGVSLSTPDYGKSVESVFRDMFSDLISWNKGFIRFLMDDKTKRDPQMESAPTWVPVFHECTSPWLDLGYYNGTNRYSATSKNKRAALPGEGATSTDTRALATVDGRFLRAAIQLHGTVLSSSGAFSSIDGVENSDLASQLQRANISKFLSWFSKLRIRTPCTPAYDSSSKAVLSVLEGRITIPSNNTNFNKWYRTMINLVVEAKDDTKLADGEFIHNAVEVLGSDPVVSQYFTTRCKRLCSEERNLFISSYGYLGSGPDNMANGDVVAVVPGVPVPMIFRDAQEESSQYTVVGPAFVHGLMKGEDWNEHRLEEVVLV